jgi:hypothetical protein
MHLTACTMARRGPAAPYRAHRLVVSGAVVRRSSDLTALRLQAEAIRRLDRKYGRRRSVRVIRGND